MSTVLPPVALHPQRPPHPAPPARSTPPHRPPRQAPVVAHASTTARYRLDADGEAWWWAPEMYELHGLDPHTTTPGTDLFLRHQHPHDRNRVQLALAGARIDGRA